MSTVDWIQFIVFGILWVCLGAIVIYEWIVD